MGVPAAGTDLEVSGFELKNALLGNYRSPDCVIKNTLVKVDSHLADSKCKSLDFDKVTVTCVLPALTAVPLPAVAQDAIMLA